MSDGRRDTFFSEQFLEFASNCVSHIASFWRPAIEKRDFPAQAFLQLFIRKPNKIVEDTLVKFGRFLNDEFDDNLSGLRMEVVTRKFKCARVSKPIYGVVEGIELKRLANPQTAGGDNVIR